MRSSTAVLFLGISQIGCSSSSIVSSPPHDEHISFSRFNALVENEKATIVLQDGSRTNGREVHAEPDSASWLDASTGVRTAVSTPTIRKIIVTNRGLGLLEGAGIGVVAGGAAGLLGAVYVGNSYPEKWKGGIAYLVLPVVGGGAGLLLGIPTGLIIGHTYEYEFAIQSRRP